MHNKANSADAKSRAAEEPVRLQKNKGLSKMDETRRFLRYITPGLTFLIEIIFLLFIAQPLIMIGKTKALGNIADLSIPFTVLIASGGIGYIFSLIHHFLFWQLYAWREWTSLIYDHRDMLKALEEKGHLKFIDQREIEKKAQDITLENAWRVVCSVWHERKEDSMRIKGADDRTTSLSDIMHGAGTSFVGSVFAVIAWLSIQLMLFEARPLWWVIPISLFIVFVHWKNYKTTVRQCQGVIEIIFADELANPSIKFSHPHRVRLSGYKLM